MKGRSVQLAMMAILSKNKGMLADFHSGLCMVGMIKFHILNDVASNGSSKNDHNNMLQLASLKLLEGFIIRTVINTAITGTNSEKK